MTSDDLGSALLAIARMAIAESLGLREAADANHPALSRPAATFVTLKQRGELRGCIGTLEAFRPLALDVRENAIGAAFRDPRFLPLAAGELARTSVEVSLLSDSETLDVADECDLLPLLHPGQDGVTLAFGGQRATFLPQVWDQLADPLEFLGALKRKAGLPANFRSPQIRYSRYAVTRWAETDPAIAPTQT